MALQKEIVAQKEIQQQRIQEIKQTHEESTSVWDALKKENIKLKKERVADKKSHRIEINKVIMKWKESAMNLL